MDELTLWLRRASLGVGQVQPRSGAAAGPGSALKMSTPRRLLLRWAEDEYATVTLRSGMLTALP